MVTPCYIYVKNTSNHLASPQAPSRFLSEPTNIGNHIVKTHFISNTALSLALVIWPGVNVS